MKPNFEVLQRINKTSYGFRQAVILLTANELDLFTILSNAYSAEEVAKMLSLDLRAVKIFLNALVNLGFLTKKGNCFKNKPEINAFLVKGGKFYLGDSLRHNFTLLKTWIHLPEVLQSGLPFRGQERTRGEKEQKDFILAMANMASLRINELFGNLDLSGRKTFLDIGGGPGTYSLEATRRYPGLTAVNFDIPETIAISKEYLKQFPESKRIKFVEGDYFTDNLGTGFDVVFISSIIHSLGEKDIKMLFKKSYDALNQGGIIIVKDSYLLDNRTEPERAVLFAVNMLVNTPEGNCYTSKEVKTWLKEIGFKNIIYKNVNQDFQYLQGTK